MRFLAPAYEPGGREFDPRPAQSADRRRRRPAGARAEGPNQSLRARQKQKGPLVGPFFFFVCESLSHCPIRRSRVPDTWFTQLVVQRPLYGLGFFLHYT